MYTKGWMPNTQGTFGPSEILAGHMPGDVHLQMDVDDFPPKTLR